MNSNPAVSVVMAVHNGERFLALAIESVLDQSFPDLELIVVDDGSNDTSKQIANRYVTSDSRTKLIVVEHSGLARALNVGISKSTAPLIARMDCDDISLPNRIEYQVNSFFNNHRLVLLGSEVELVSEEGLYLGPRRHPRIHSDIRRSLLGGNGGALTHPAVMIRRSAFEKVGGYDEKMTTGQDLDLFLRLSEAGTVENLSDTLLLWRQHRHSINRTSASTWPEMRARAIEKTIDRIGASRYTSELFSLEIKHCFPDGHGDLARLAASNRRFSSALELLWIDFKMGATPLSLLRNFLSILWRMRPSFMRPQ